MRHFATSEFWRLYRELPDEVRALADKNFALLKENPAHRSLRLKKVGIFWSARVGLDYRVLAKRRPEGMLWFWIGPHEEYERRIK